MGGEALWLKSPHGKWVEGEVELEGSQLKWTTKGEGAEDVSIALTKGIQVKPVLFGLRKHVFEVDADKTVWQFAAKNDQEREEWVEKLCKKAGIEINKKSSSPGKISAQRQPSNIRVAGLQALLQGLPGGATLGGGIMTQEEATKKLQEKLRGKVKMDSQISEEGCLVCKFRIDKADILQLPKKKGVVHQTCFYCAKCGENLSADAFKYDKKASKLYCPEHFEGTEEESEDESEEEQVSDKEEKENQGDEEEEKGSSEPEKKASEKKERNNSTIDHAAVMSRPTVRGRRPPTTRITRKPMSAVNIPDADKEEHFNAFHILVGPKGPRVILFFDFLTQKRQWLDTICNATEVARLKQELENAQRVDMFSAIQAQMNLENFEQTHKTTVSGTVSVCIRKKAKDNNTKWKKLFVTLGENRMLEVYETQEKATNPKTKPLVQVDFSKNPTLIEGNSKNEITYANAKADRQSLPKKTSSPSSKTTSPKAKSQVDTKRVQEKEDKKDQVEDTKKEEEDSEESGEEEEDDDIEDGEEEDVPRSPKSSASSRSSSSSRSKKDTVQVSTLASVTKAQEMDRNDEWNEAESKVEQVSRGGYCGTSCVIV